MGTVFNICSFQEEQPVPVIDGYITFSGVGPFTIFSEGGKSWDGIIEYSTDGESWTEWNGTETISSVDDQILLRGTGNTYITNGQTSSVGFRFAGSQIYCSGDIETLLDYSIAVSGGHPVMAERCFAYLFSRCDLLLSAPDLPATILSSRCYAFMFFNCTSLQASPDLQATILASECYYGMFTGCKALTQPPDLPATILEPQCYRQMFINCSALTRAPELPAINLTTSCYYSMFSGCQSLTIAPKLSAKVMQDSCYYSMFYGCKSLTRAPALPANILAPSCYKYMFRGCTSLNNTPALPAKILSNDCYYQMFYGCTSLTDLPELSAITLTNNCYSGMFQGCSNIKLSRTKTGIYQTPYRIPSDGTGTASSGAMSGMFRSTGGTYTSDPSINTIYYTSGNVIDSAIYLLFTCNDQFMFKMAGVEQNTTKQWDGSLEYSLDGESWTEWNGQETIESINNQVLLRGSGNTHIGNSFYIDIPGQSSDVLVECKGNIETLLDYSTVASGTHPTMANGCFSSLFNGCNRLGTAPKLPALTLSDYCYSNMFAGTSIKKAPELPATVLANGCYLGMFSSSKLEEVSELPATSLLQQCYDSMFYNCDYLTNLPDLTVIPLVQECYANMFTDCGSLKVSLTRTEECPYIYRIPSFGTGTDAYRALYEMFEGTSGSFTGTPIINTYYYTNIPSLSIQGG